MKWRISGHLLGDIIIPSPASHKRDLAKKRACCKMNCSTPKNRCHPERLKKIADFRKESKDLRTELTANVPSVRRSFDALRLLRMTDFRRAAKTVFCSAPYCQPISGKGRGSGSGSGIWSARYRKVTTWERRHRPLGLKAVAEAPVVTPFSKAHRTAFR